MADLTDVQILTNLNEKLRKYVALRERLDARIEKTKAAIEIYSETTGEEDNFTLTEQKKPVSEYVYNKESTWKEKIISLLKHTERAMTTTQIIDAIVPNESEMTYNQVYTAVSSNLNQLLNLNAIKRFVPEGKKMKGYFYAAPQWFDIEGNLMKRYMPIESKNILSIWDT